MPEVPLNSDKHKRLEDIRSRMILSLIATEATLGEGLEVFALVAAEQIRRLERSDRRSFRDDFVEMLDKNLANMDEQGVDIEKLIKGE